MTRLKTHLLDHTPTHEQDPQMTPHQDEIENTENTEILRLTDVQRGFNKAQDERLVLDGVNLTLKKGEIVGLLGRSGSGKSTLLRIIAGLIAPTGGTVEYLGKPVSGPAQGIAMVFQTFALFPWLTVLENVEAGLEALGLGVAERRERALAAIDLIGMDGFENAYPRELSGGMRQRVGFARAVVVNPTLLLMDEPFSALDVLSAETLRTDFLELWNEHRLLIQSVLLITHNIEEAVFMCDRILILSSNPGRVMIDIEVPFQHPRDRLDPAFRVFVDMIYAKMTARPKTGAKRKVLKLGSWLPEVSTNLMAGLIETLEAPPYNGRADLPEIARTLHLEVDDLFPVAEMLQHLNFADIREGDILLTHAGKVFAQNGTQERKQQFAAQLLHHVPLASRIHSVLQARPGQHVPRVFFEQELSDFLSESASKETLDAVINWGRYAEIFSYSDQAEIFALDSGL